MTNQEFSCAVRWFVINSNRLDYPGGDVPATMGVCTDVVIRSLRNAYAFDLQKAVHEDMEDNFSIYPALWGHTKSDKNIDHRRVPNLEVYFYRINIGGGVEESDMLFDHQITGHYRFKRG